MSQNGIPLLRKTSGLQWKLSRKDNILSKYDPFKYPADFSEAQKHRIARRVCTPDVNLDSERCECCMLPIQNQLIPLNCELQDLAHLGLAYPLYFVFLKLCTLLMTVHLLSVGIVQLTLNLVGDQCSQLNVHTRICRLSFVNSLQFGNLTITQVQNGLNIGFVIISIIIVQVIKHRSKMFVMKVSIHQKIPADYSIMINGLPKDITIYEIQHFLDEQLNSLHVDPTLVKIYLIYDVKEYLALYAKKRQVYDQKCYLTDHYNSTTKKALTMDDQFQRKKMLKKAESIFQEISETENIYETIEAQIERYQQSFKIIVQNLKKQEAIDQIDVPKQVKFSGKCIVTINNYKSVEALLSHYQLTFRERVIYRIQELLKLDSAYSKKYKGQIIKIGRPPDPSDLIFGNFGSFNIVRIKHRLMVTFIIASLVSLTFVILAFGKKMFNESKVNSRNPLIYSFLASISVAFFNSILGRLVRHFSLDQNYSKQSSYYYYVARRITVVYLGNMILTTLLANVASFYLIGQPSASTYPGISLNMIGLMNDFFFINATNSLIAIVFTYIDYRYIFRMAKKWYITNYRLVTQAQANLCYENQPIDMALKYSHAYRLLLFTAAVAPCIPNALLISLAVIVLVYVVDKYILLRRLMLQYKLGYALSARMLRILNMYPLLVSLSNFLIMCIPFAEDQTMPSIHFYLALVTFLLTLTIELSPTSLVQKILHQFFKSPIQEEEETKTYKNLQQQFSEDYSHYYPYFRVSTTTSNEQQSLSPRKNKLLDQTNKKLSQSVFGLLRDYMDNKKFNPNS